MQRGSAPGAATVRRAWRRTRVQARHGVGASGGGDVRGAAAVRGAWHRARGKELDASPSCASPPNSYELDTVPFLRFPPSPHSYELDNPPPARPHHRQFPRARH
eukprot:186300-Chlamydomonas_euryale.AAC.2